MQCSWISKLRPAIVGLGLIWVFFGSPVGAEPDFREVVKSVVSVRVQVPATARTARSLGTSREGSGVVIDEQGLVLTVGYLVMESQQVSLETAQGVTVPAAFVAYDHTSGFGLVRALTPLGVAPLAFGSSREMTEKSVALVVSRRDFAGAWEYLLEQAIYTMPPHRSFGGAALINEQGQLVGIGSLFVNDAMAADAATPGNLFVPTDLIKPILSDLLAHGRRTKALQPWLGIYTGEQGGRVFVTRVAEAGPGQRAGIKPGDVVMGVGGRRVSGMVDFYQRVRDSGPAGTAVEIDLLPYGGAPLEIRKVSVKSQDRHDWLSRPPSH